MDVDLSTQLDHIPDLIWAIAHGGYDIATGSRLMRESQTTRSLRREIISRVYNLLVKGVLFTCISDAQCGFKALSRNAVEQIVPQIKDQSWFFDTELLVLAEKQGYRIKDIPVVWVEDGDSRVKIIRTGWDDIKGVIRLRRQLWTQGGPAFAKRALPNARTGPSSRMVPGNVEQAEPTAETEVQRSARLEMQLCRRQCLPILPNRGGSLG